MKINVKAILFLLILTLSLTSTVSALNYDYYDLSDGRSSNIERSLRLREQESYERSINYERIDQYNRLRRNRFLDDSPYYYDRIYYNRDNNYGYRYYDDSSISYRTSVVKFQKYERFDRSLEIDRIDRNSSRRVQLRDRRPRTYYYDMPYYDMYSDMMYY